MSAASTDGRYIAYQWHGGALDVQDELLLIDVATRTVTTLWRAPAGVEVRPGAWSRDGLTIAGTLEHEDDTSEVFATPVPDLEPHIVASGRARNPSFNDDGRLMAFEKRSEGLDDPNDLDCRRGVRRAVPARDRRRRLYAGVGRQHPALHQRSAADLGAVRRQGQ